MRITNLEKSIGTFQMEIDDLYIEHGRIHGIAGPNGCGKTVFLKMLAGIMTPDSGVIDYEGLTARDITMMSQRPYLMQTSVYENLVYPLKIRGMKPDGPKIDQMLSRAGLLGQKRQYARSLSSGERQKLSFLRSIIFWPRLIMVDETLSNLDPESEALFEGIIREIQSRDAITWLIVNHQMDHITKLCDEIHHMEKGRFVRE